MKNIDKNIISIDSTILESLNSMKISSSKCLVVLDSQSKFLGTLSDGDIRRAILKKISLQTKISKIYNKKPFYININEKNNFNLKEIFKNKKFEILPIINKDRNLIEIIHWSDVIFGETSEEKKLQDYEKFSLFIMAGGKGLRLKPITNFLPKSLLPLDGEPMISHIINKFTQIGINDVHISINYQDKITKNYIKSNYNKRFKIYEEKEQLGTIGSLGFFRKTNKLSEIIIVSNCDILIDYDLNKIFRDHMDKKSDITIVAIKDNYSIPYGVLKTNKKNFLEGINEKPNFDFIFSSGLYLINFKTLKLIKKNQKLDFNEFMNKALNLNLKINVYNIPRDNWIDIGNFTELKKLIN